MNKLSKRESKYRKCKPPYNTQFISVDLAPEGCSDFCIITSICGDCRTVIARCTYDDYKYGMNMTVFYTCPNCGVRFKYYDIIQQ